MNSTLKPVTAAVPQGGQSSPAKANIAGVNHAGHPQGAQKGNNQVGGNPSLAPVSANMAQMAQNMSHHGNLSLIGQNSVTPSNSAASPSKSASAPLSLVQDKVTSSSQPLALTRTPEKAEVSVSQSNGTVDSPKSSSSTSNVLKPQNAEPEKKQDIAKTSPSTPKPPEKPTGTPSTPQKADSSTAQVLPDSSSHPKAATASEPSEKSPAKPIESKQTTADVAPSQTEAKPVPESANDNQCKEENKEKPPAKVEEPKAEDNVDGAPKVEKAPEVTPPKAEEKAAPVDDKKAEEPAKPEVVKPDVEETKPQAPKEIKSASKPTLKLATVTPPVRKRRQASANKEVTPAQTAEGEPSTPDSRSKRNRTQVQLYQSPTPELAMATKLSASAGRSTPTKQNDDKLIVFYKNEYLAVRNAEGGFYVCQSVQNVYRTTRKIKIRWLSQDKTADPSGETYKPDFYDITDMECVLTTLSLSRAPSGGGSQILTAAEAARAKSILERAIKHEQGQNTNNMELTEEHPDGLDLSLYTDESQLEKKRKRNASSKASPKTKAVQNADENDDDDDDEDSEPTPSKRLRTAPKRSPKSARKPKSVKSSNKRKSAGSTPNVAPASKTATAVTEKPAPVKTRTPAKRTPAKPVVKETPVVADKGKTPKRSTRESKASPIVPTPSTSTGKSTRTPRKPPAKK